MHVLRVVSRGWPVKEICLKEELLWPEAGHGGGAGEQQCRV